MTEYVQSVMTLHFIQVVTRDVDSIRALWLQLFFPSRFPTVSFLLFFCVASRYIS